MPKKEVAFHARRMADGQTPATPGVDETHPTEDPGRASALSPSAGPAPGPGRGPPEIIRLPEVRRRTGLSRTTIWRKVRAGTFPAPLDLGKNSIGWHADEIAGWVSGRPRRTYGAPKMVEQVATA